MTLEIPTIHLHTFRDIGSDQTVVSYGADREKAHQAISSPDRYVYVSSEEIPYTHAAVALAVAAALPGDWLAAPISEEYRDCNWTLQRADGLELFLSAPCYSHRAAWRVSYSTPRHEGSSITAHDLTTRNRISIPSIGIGVAKSPEQMAADISRRLIADAEHCHAAYVATIADMTAAANARVASLRAVSAELGVHFTTDLHSGQPHFAGHAEGVSYEVHPGGSVTFTLHAVEAGLAVRVAAALESVL